MLYSSSFSFRTSVHGGTAPSPPEGPQFYVNPSTLGGGDGLTPATACQISAVWAKVSPVKDQGVFINMLGEDPATDGHYTGANSMIVPSAGIAGISGSPITIRAVNDGGVLIDGEGVRAPLNLDGPTRGNNYFTLEGFDVTSGGGPFAVVSGSGHHLTFRRVVAYDTTDEENKHVWSFTGNTGWDTVYGCNILVEDCAGFGYGRKILEFFNASGPNIARRFYGRWERSLNTGPKRVLQDDYHSGGLTVDNLICRVYDLTPASYTLLNNGVPAPYPSVTSCSQGTPNAPVAGQCQYPGTSLLNESTGYFGENEYTVGSDGIHVDSHNRLNGILFLQLSGEPICMFTGTTRGMFEHKTFGDTAFRDTFVYLQPGVVDKFRSDTQGMRGFVLGASADNGAGLTASQCSLTNTTSIGPVATTDNITAKYTVTNKITGANMAAVGLAVDTGPAGPAETLYRGTSGAKLRYRYENGVLTATPLWPWPMSARIKAAMTRASTDGHGHAIDDIDANIQATFGAFPD